MLSVASTFGQRPHPKMGQEVAVPVHLQDGQESQRSTRDLISYGMELFTAMSTSQEGGGRPLTKGTAAKLSDPGAPLTSPATSIEFPALTLTPAPDATTNLT